MVGVISLIGVNHGEASDAMTMSSLDLSAKKRSLPNSLKARGPNTKSQKINADEKENITTESSSDASIEIDEKENTAIVLLPDSFAESSSDSSAADPFDIDEAKIDKFVEETVIPYWKPNEKKLKNPEEIYKTLQLLIDELNAEDKIDRIIAYIDNQAFHPGLLIKKGLEDANDVDSFLNALECVVFNNIQ